MLARWGIARYRRLSPSRLIPSRCRHSDCTLLERLVRGCVRRGVAAAFGVAGGGYPIRNGFFAGIAPAGAIGMQRTAPYRAVGDLVPVVVGAGEAEGLDRLPGARGAGQRPRYQAAGERRHSVEKGSALLLLPIMRLGARDFSAADSTMRSAEEKSRVPRVFPKGVSTGNTRRHVWKHPLHQVRRVDGNHGKVRPPQQVGLPIASYGRQRKSHECRGCFQRVFPPETRVGTFGNTPCTR